MAPITSTWSFEILKIVLIRAPVDFRKKGSAIGYTMLDMYRPANPALITDFSKKRGVCRQV